jgi:ribose transport system permease protein
MKRWIGQNRGCAAALLLFSALYLADHLLLQNFNELVAIGCVARAQTVPVLRGGLDLSVGAIITLASCVASVLVNGTPLQIAFGIIATLATGTIAIGLALLIRPQPGGNSDSDLNWALTNSVGDFAETYGLAQAEQDGWLHALFSIPVPLILLFGVACLVWLPFKRSVTGRAIHAIGSAQGAASASGLPIRRASIAAFPLGGFFAACGGLYLTIQTSTGNADLVQAGTYTLNSIAAVVLGGTAPLGGTGGVIASIPGTTILRAVPFSFRSLDIDPLLQPLIEGLVLLTAVSAVALRTFRVKNQLELFR